MYGCNKENETKNCVLNTCSQLPFSAAMHRQLSRARVIGVDGASPMSGVKRQMRAVDCNCGERAKAEPKPKCTITL